MRGKKFLVGLLAVMTTLVLLAPAQLSAASSASSTSPSSTSGSLALQTADPVQGDELMFTYSTTAAEVDPLNWVAIYDDPSDGPVNQAYVAASTVWTRATEVNGTVTLASTGLTAGTKVAYLLAKDGYTWLATPVAFTLYSATSPTPTGSLSLTSAAPSVGDQVSFAFSTDSGHQNNLNWVAIYDQPTDGPIDQSDVASSTAYHYVSDLSGSISFDTSGLTPGAKVAYFLYDDGYTWLARPVSFFLAPSATTGPSADGTLALITTNPTVDSEITFSYSTATVDSLNWVGLYDNPADGPTDQKYHAGSTVWARAPLISGAVTLSTAAMSIGTHTAYFLYNDDYSWLAQPVTFTLVAAPPPPPPPHFVTDDFAATPVAPHRAVNQPLAGLWIDTASATTTYRKTSGDGWLSVSESGVVTGTAPNRPSTHPALITVLATDGAGHQARTTVEVSVEKRSRQLKVASWNTWDAGAHVDSAAEKDLRTILTEGLDVVGLQETNGTDGKNLATRLGWNYSQSDGDLAIISRYPLIAGYQPSSAVPALSATVEALGTTLVVWTSHLDETGYGPYAACFDGQSATAVRQQELASTRYHQAQSVLAAMRSDLRRARSRPVLLLADLASPSPLDWTRATSAAHCGAGALAWPVTAAVSGAGLRDSFRVANPNPSTEPGITWSPIQATNANGEPEPQDRIDYVDFVGALRVVESHALVTGFPKPLPDVTGNSWTSDHAAAVTTFSL
jgi:hypothetical protein